MSIGEGKGTKEAIIIGGGIGGLATAIALRSAGWDVQVYERAPELGEIGAGLAIWRNGIQALGILEVKELALETAPPIEWLVLRTADGGVLQEMPAEQLSGQMNDGSDDPTGIAIPRSVLQRILADQVDQRVHLGKECVSVDEDGGRISARFADGDEVSGDILVGADGIWSVVRKSLHPDVEPQYLGIGAWLGLCRDNGSMLAEGIAIQTWGRGKRFAAALAGEAVFWGASIPAPSGAGGSQREGKQQALETFSDWHEPIPDLISQTAQEDVLWVELFELNPLPHWGQGHITLLGDAAHLMAPFMGQGACQALEDAIVLAQCLKHEPDTETALRRYEKKRQRRTAWLARASRRMGRLSHLSNPVGVAVRNSVIKIIPTAISTMNQKRAMASEF